MLELVDEHNLPDFLGGKCTQFGAHKDGVGPWNDYEVVEPVGIRKKQQEGAAVDAITAAAGKLAISDSKEESKHQE